MSWKNKIILGVGIGIAVGFFVSTYFYNKANPYTFNVRGLMLPTYYFYDGYSSVEATGTWYARGDTLANRMHTISLRCVEESMLCKLIQAEISPENLLHTYEEDYVVKKWDKEQIIAQSEESLCTRYTILIDRKSEMVTATRNNIGGGELCEGITPVLQLQLSDVFLESERKASMSQ